MGTEERLRELLGGGILAADGGRTYVFRYPSAGYFIEHYRRYFRPIRWAFETLDAADGEALELDLEEFLTGYSVSGDETLVILLPTIWR